MHVYNQYREILIIMHLLLCVCKNCWVIFTIHSPDWFPLGEAEVRVRSGVIDGNGGALDLVTPAGKVAEGIDGESHVCLEGQRVDRSRVNAL